LGFGHLLFGMGGDADQVLRARDGPCVFRREVVLAEMDAVEVGQQGEIDTVVQEEAAWGAEEDFGQDGGVGEDLPRGARLVAVLQGLDARDASAKVRRSVARAASTSASTMAYKGATIMSTFLPFCFWEKRFHAKPAGVYP
jgi:hypothetical protein